MNLLNALHRANKKLDKKYKKSKEKSDLYEEKVDSLTLAASNLIADNAYIQ